MSTRAWMAFAVVAALLTVRAWHEHVVLDDPRIGWVYNDFRDAIYFPARALLDGHDPYDGATHLATYPVGNRFPLYSPAMLLVHAPWALAPFAASAVLHWLTTLGLTVLLAHLAWRAAGGGAAGTMALATLVLASRPGQQNLLNGQPTLELVLAVYLVLRYAVARPGLAACGLALASIKGTWALPLVVLMLAAGWWRATVLGLGLAGVANGLVAAVLAWNAGGVGALFGPLMVAAGTTHTIPEGHPALSYTRIDAVALVGRVLGRSPGTVGSIAITGLILAVAAAAVHRVVSAVRDDRDESDLLDPWLVGIVTLTILTCVYQQPYSMLLAFFPLAALVRGRPGAMDARLRAILVLLLALPMANFAATAQGLRLLGLTVGPEWVALTSLNGLALLSAWAIFVGASWRVAGAAALPASPTTWRAHWDAHPAPAASFRREADLYVQRLRADIPIAPDHDVLDFGCGFGFAAATLAPAVRTMQVWEPAAAMAGYARAVLADHANVRWPDLESAVASDAAPTVDLVLMNSVAQYMSEPELAAWLRGFHAILRPGGRVVVSDLIPPDHSLVREGLGLALRHPRFVLDRVWTWSGDYLGKMQRLPLLRFGLDDLRRLAADAGLGLEVQARNLTHFPGRTTVVLRRVAP